MSLSGKTQPRQRVVVVGGSAVDVEGVVVQDNELHAGNSTPGRIRYAVGGVGRNIAENLARLGIDVWLVSAVGADPFGNYVREETAASGVNISGVVSLAGERTGCYLSVLDARREVVNAIADIDVVLKLSRALDTVEPIIRSADLLILDCNISEDMLRTAVSLCPRSAPIVVDPVSAQKALRARSILDRVTLITPNRIEAEALVAADNTHTTGANSSAEQLAQVLQALGVKEIIITLGKEGVYWSGASDTSGSGKRYRSPTLTDQAQSVTGAGDAFLAGVIYAWVCGYSGAKRLFAGFAAASIAMESERAVNPQMSSALLKSRIDIQQSL